MFCLHELSDWSYQDLAEEFAMTAGAVGVALHRARQKLQELLKKHDQVSAVATEKRRT